MIKSHLAQLRQSLGMRQPISAVRFRSHYDEQDYAGLVNAVRDSMKVDARIRVGLVNSGGPANAVAWVSLPSPMPRYGSAEFKATLFTVYLRKSHLVHSSFEQVLATIAHELSHIVLAGIGQPLADCEEAVDLAAMLLGYRDIYVASARYSEVGPSKFLEKLVSEIKRSFFGNKVRQYQWLGYLKPEEVSVAAKLLGRRWVRTPRPGPNRALVAIATSAERLASLALVLALLGVAGLISAFFR